MDEQKHIELENDKNKWISKNNFVSYGKFNLKKLEIKNYIGLKPLGCPLNYDFRPNQKDKWLVKRDFSKY